jgi:hypothetical protein
VSDFISEDDLSTFEGWLRYQGIDAATTTPDELADWRDMFDEGRERSLATPKVGRMKLGPLAAGEYRYAVAVREGSDLWLTLWVRRSKRATFMSWCRAPIGVGIRTQVITVAARCTRRSDRD